MDANNNFDFVYLAMDWMELKWMDLHTYLEYVDWLIDWWITIFLDIDAT